jgi:hypothetical protein
VAAEVDERLRFNRQRRGRAPVPLPEDERDLGTAGAEATQQDRADHRPRALGAAGDRQLMPEALRPSRWDVQPCTQISPEHRRCRAQLMRATCTPDAVYAPPVRYPHARTPGWSVGDPIHCPLRE